MVEFESRARRATRLWYPRQFCPREAGDQSDAAQLRVTITQCVDAWIERYPSSMIELSGGFDSAVVAAAGKGRHPGLGINFFTADLSGDERRYARTVASHIGMPLHEMFMPVAKLGEDDLEGMPVGLRPGLGSTTLFHDRRLTEAAARVGVEALLTGQGGDAIFFQHPTPMIATERQFPRFSAQAHARLAQWCGTSIWTTVRHAFGRRIEREPSPPDEAMYQLPLAVPVSEAALGWAGDLGGLTPAKRFRSRRSPGIARPLARHGAARQ